jgi:predicted RNA binding protein YcfA (HicA-like mRNA interferase family)
MASKYPVLKASEVVRCLEKLGFVFKSKNGSHAKYVRIIKGRPKQTAIVPIHSTDIPKGTLQGILEQAGISLREFMSKM